MPHSFSSVGQTYKDFVVTKYLPLHELQGTLIELVHTPSKASILHIQTDDPENLFCLSLQTRPSSSNGVAHILEHTVLCGSEKYPVKDPFFAMSRRSLNTFMNAMTGQDFTCYPASSQVEKDFYNLLEVYLDAVFHPELKKMSFLQEGHRLEFTEPDNPQSPLQYSGIVYNEMKGDMTSAESRLWKSLCKHLVPDLTYAHNSGGDPEQIPNLTYEELLTFHRTFYHPSRCLFFFYGNLPLEKHLDFLLEKELHKVQPIAQLPPILKQRRFLHPLTASDSYPIGENESPDKKTQIAFAWLTVPLNAPEKVLALSLIDALLMDTDASLLKMALLKSGLCSQAGSLIDPEMSEVPWTIVCKGCNPEDASPLKDLIFNTLKTALAKPFTKEQIEACIHQLEFERTEINPDGGPFGLTLFMRSALLKQHGSEPEQGLFIHSLFHQLRKNVLDPSYLSNFLKEVILENPHFVQLTLVPDPSLQKKESEEEQRRLREIERKMQPEERQAILLQSKELAAMQEAIEHQSLDCLPKVTLRDVPAHARDFTLHATKTKDLTVLHHSCFTNQILYADLLFNLPHIDAKDLPLLSLFTRLLSEVGCGGKNYVQTLEYAQAHTGGISASLSLHPTQKDPNTCRPTLAIRGKSLARNAAPLFKLFADFATSADFTDEERIKELVKQHATSLQNRFVKNAMNYAIQTSLAAFSIPSFVNDQWSGLPYYQFIQEALKNPPHLIQELQRLQQDVLCSQNPDLVLGCDDALMQQLKDNNFFGLADNLSSKKLPSWKGGYQLPKIPSQARLIPSPVAFTALGMRTASYETKESPFLLIATELLQNCILHKEIREKGGAYGADASYAPTTGNFYFYSYRDPQLAKTVATFEKAIEKIGQLKFNDRELEEAKLGVIQMLDAPVPPQGRAMAAYAWQRAGRTWKMREDFRNRVLSASKQDIASAVRGSLPHSPKTLVTFLGQEIFEKEKKKLKTHLISIPL